jgi:hypothetical protein
MLTYVFEPHLALIDDVMLGRNVDTRQRRRDVSVE